MLNGLSFFPPLQENNIQKNLAERHAIFRKCRMEEIDLPLKKGSLFDLSEPGADDMEVDTQQAQELYEAESEIKLDFSGLDAKLKQSKSKETEDDLEDQIKRILVDIENAAPNMRAIDKSVPLLLSFTSFIPPFPTNLFFSLNQ